MVCEIQKCRFAEHVMWSLISWVAFPHSFYSLVPNFVLSLPPLPPTTVTPPLYHFSSSPSATYFFTAPWCPSALSQWPPTMETNQILPKHRSKHGHLGTQWIPFRSQKVQLNVQTLWLIQKSFFCGRVKSGPGDGHFPIALVVLHLIETECFEIKNSEELEHLDSWKPKNLTKVMTSLNQWSVHDFLEFFWNQPPEESSVKTFGPSWFFKSWGFTFWSGTEKALWKTCLYELEHLVSWKPKNLSRNNDPSMTFWNFFEINPPKSLQWRRLGHHGSSKVEILRIHFLIWCCWWEGGLKNLLKTD